MSRGWRGKVTCAGGVDCRERRGSRRGGGGGGEGEAGGGGAIKFEGEGVRGAKGYLGCDLWSSGVK